MATTTPSLFKTETRTIDGLSGRSPVQVRASAPDFPTCFFSISSLFHFPDPLTSQFLNPP
jgi:hypothetical protein